MNYTVHFYFFLVLEAKKPLIVVVNENLMNNHQTELAEKLSGDGHLEYCVCSTLCETIEKFDPLKLKPFPPWDLNAFAKFIDSLFPPDIETSETGPTMDGSLAPKSCKTYNTNTNQKEEAEYLRYLSNNTPGF